MRSPEVIIKKLQVTEKQTALQSALNKYFFLVAPEATKQEIKRAVEKLFTVKVAKVNTMVYEGKKKRERISRYGKRSDWKRAIVTLKGDSKIDLT
jgi:large subunit ribosomal protein L23